jgi:hypothetical protein
MQHSGWHKLKNEANNSRIFNEDLSSYGERTDVATVENDTD